MNHYDERSKIDSSLSGGARVQKPMTRIDNQVQAVKMYIDRIQTATERVSTHAHALGFFAPEPPLIQGDAPKPVISCLEDALRELDRSIDTLSGALNLFD